MARGGVGESQQEQTEYEGPFFLRDVPAGLMEARP